MLEIDIIRKVVLVKENFVWRTCKESSRKSVRDGIGEESIVEYLIDCKSVLGILLKKF